MILNQELVKKIRSYFSLNIYETKVWLALLTRGIASAGEIAEMSGVPRSRTYDVLESLEKQGFAITKLGKPVKYIAVKPTTILEKLKANTVAYAEERVKTLSKLKETQEYSELESLYNTGIIPVKQSDLSGAIKGKTNVFNHIRELLESANKEVIICTSVNEINEKSRLYTSLFNVLDKRKINVKIALSGEDTEIRKINIRFKIKAKKLELKSRFFIIDGEQMVFLTSNNSNSSENDQELGIWINSQFFVNSVAYLFDQAWGK